MERLMAKGGKAMKKNTVTSMALAAALASGSARAFARSDYAVAAASVQSILAGLCYVAGIAMAAWATMLFKARHEHELAFEAARLSAAKDLSGEEISRQGPTPIHASSSSAPFWRSAPMAASLAAAILWGLPSFLGELFSFLI